MGCAGRRVPNGLGASAVAWGWLALLLSSSASLAAEPASLGLSSARAAAQRLDFDGALSELRAAMESGKAKQDETWQLFAMTGEVLAALGNHDAAMAAYGRALSLNPAFALKPDSSPRYQEPFFAARALTGGRPLSATVKSQRAGEGEVATQVSIRDDPYRLVQTVRLFPGSHAEPQQAPLGEGVSNLRWACTASPCPYWLLLLDVWGNELTRLGTPDQPLELSEKELPEVSLAPERAPPRPEEARPFWRRPAAWALGASVAGSVAAGYFGYRFADAQRALGEIDAEPLRHTWAEAKRLDDQRRQDRAGMFVGLGLAAGGALTAVFLW